MNAYLIGSAKLRGRGKGHWKARLGMRMDQVRGIATQKKKKENK